jgi:carboxyl-terminal processing protease
MKRALILVVVTASSLAAQTADDFRDDFEFAIQRIDATYAYFDIKSTRWNEVASLYAADLKQVTNREQFIALLERVVDELYDPHAQLNVNLQNSPRLVPSGTDLWAEWRGGKATITQVRADSDAERAGVKPNTVVVSFDSRPIADVVVARMGRSYPHSTAATRDWALRAVLAGHHNTRRVLGVQEGSMNRTIELPAANQFITARSLVTATEIRPGIGHIRINDSLGNASLIAEFDRTLAGFRSSRGLILDLRNTPSGGNSTVARGILGRFVTREQPYQKHALVAEERAMGVRRSWLELVSPRGEFIYSRPVAVLVNRWTGSMGEGLAIGFDATRAATVVGTPMAGLVGATFQITLPRTRIGINIPAERLYHVSGVPREQFQPSVLVDVTRSDPRQDPFLAAALRVVGAR